MSRSVGEDGSSFTSRSSIEDDLKLISMETYSGASAYRSYTPRNPRRRWMVLMISIVSFIICMTFASMYGLDYNKIKKEGILEEPQFAELRNLSTYIEEKACGNRDEAANLTIWNDIVNRTSDLLEEKFTIAIQTYKRPRQLKKTLAHLTEHKVPSLHEIVVVWNEIDAQPPADFETKHGVLVRYRKSKMNSLNQKFLPDPAYRTQGILLSDDDWNYNTTGDLEYVFQQWRKAGMHRLTGAFARCWQDNDVTGTPMYNSNCKGQDGYSMILSGLAFTHISYLEYYHSEDDIMTGVRELVDAAFNCEDIALNFLVKDVNPPHHPDPDQVENIILPRTFTIHRYDESETKFKLRGNAGCSPLSIKCSYKSTEDDFEARVNLQSSNNESAPPLATIKYSTHNAELEIPNAVPPNNISMHYRLLKDRNAEHSFRLDRKMFFEWKNIGDGEGWKLYLYSNPGQVLATGALNMGSDKPTRFEFKDVEAVKELSQECRIIIIASWLRIWDHVRIRFRRAPDEGEADLILCSCCLCVIL
ncbi:exostoses 3 [Fusarium heterosporum]|uniref:Exostoses 3 n=1 Tax=Fusarium heterosporum TaxID=42747 RepID=A0A8H5WZV1_FUSHE|nr:exostoses 3 [Fusarium heterosporum]